MNHPVNFNLEVAPSTDMTELAYRQAVLALSVGLQGAFQAFPQLWIRASTGRGHQEVHDVHTFHRKFMVPMSPVPAFLDPAAHEFRFKFLHEELAEFQQAYGLGDLEKAFDALLDLVYVAVGTALMMGLPWGAGWERVQKANMEKELAKPDGSNSKRGSPLDVVKPAGWVAPKHWDLFGLQPEDTPPVFNASAAIEHLAECRRDNKPLLAIQEFVHHAPPKVS